MEVDHDDDDDHYCTDVYDDKTRMMPILMKLMTMMILLTMLTIIMMRAKEN